MGNLIKLLDPVEYNYNFSNQTIQRDQNRKNHNTDLFGHVSSAIIDKIRKSTSEKLATKREAIEIDDKRS